MQEYGIIKDNKLQKSDKQLTDYKLIQYAEIPEFDQMTEGVFQKDPTEDATKIYIGVEIRAIEITEGDNFDEFI